MSMRFGKRQALEAIRLLTDPTRHELFARLVEAGDSGVCVKSLVETSGVSRPSATISLSSLRLQGLATTRRDGHWIYYLATPRGAALYETIRLALQSLED